MIISRTPYRVSFFGGGADYHTWYENYGARIITSSINHYCYLLCRPLPPFFQHKTRVTWSRHETVSCNDQIQHPIVNIILKYFNIDNGMDIYHHGDLPARTGLGTSSAFTVGLLNAIHCMLGNDISKKELSYEAVHIERDLLKESVGVQDQIETAFGGINEISIDKDGLFEVIPLNLPAHRKKLLEKHLMLFYTGVSRNSSSIAFEKIINITKKKKEMMEMQELVGLAISLLKDSNRNIDDFGRLLNTSWHLKKSLTKKISNDFIDNIYNRAIKAGVLGGKLLGAGGGGVFMFFVPPEQQQTILDELSELLYIPFLFENEGSKVILDEDIRYTVTGMQRRDFAHLCYKNKTSLNEERKRFKKYKNK